jgi:hypothetical protein
MTFYRRTTVQQGRAARKVLFEIPAGGVSAEWPTKPTDSLMWAVYRRLYSVSKKQSHTIPTITILHKLQFDQ